MAAVGAAAFSTLLLVALAGPIRPPADGGSPDRDGQVVLPEPPRSSPTPDATPDLADGAMDGSADCTTLRACASWQLPLGHDMVQAGDLLVVVRHDAVMAYGALSGQLRWFHTRRQAQGVPPAAPRSVHAVGASSLLVHYAGWVELVDRVDGAVSWSLPIELEDLEVVDDDERVLVLSGPTAAGEARIVVADPDTGRLRWELAIAAARAPVLLDEGVVLVPDEHDGTTAIGARDGEVRWQRPEVVTRLARVVGETPDWLVRSILGVAGEDTLELVTPTAGSTLAVLDGVDATTEVVGPWLLAGDRELIDPATGEPVARFEHPVAASLRTMSDVVVATRVSHASRPAHLEVMSLHGGTGQPRWSATIPGPWTCCLSMTRVQRDGVLQIAGRDGRAVTLDPGTGEVVDRRSVPLGDGDRVQWVGSLALVQRGEQVLAVDGPGGRLDLAAPVELIATAPLLVRGPGGVARVDDARLRGLRG